MIPSCQTKIRYWWAWRVAKAGVFVLPLFPALGEVVLFGALIATWRQKYRQIIQSPLNWGLTLLSLLLVVSACFAFNRIEALLGLANFLPFFVFFAAFSCLISTPQQLRQLAWLVVISAVPVVGLGLGQLWGGWQTPELFLSLFGWELVPGGEPPGRMSSVFIYANFLAVYLLIVWMLGLGLWIDTYRIWRKDYKRGWILLFLTAVMIVVGIGIVFSNSRNAWAIAFLGSLAFALYLGWYWLILVIGSCAGAVFWASFGSFPGRDWLRQVVPAYFWARLSDQLYPDRPLASLRVTQWHFAWEMTAQRPWLGWGLRNFTVLYQARMNWWLGHPHNLFLMLTAETGIFATLLFVALVGWILTRAAIMLQKDLLWQKQPAQLILFTYLVAFGSCTVFNFLDVSLYDLRVNTLGWSLLSAIGGVVYSNQNLNLYQKKSAVKKQKKA